MGKEDIKISPYCYAGIKISALPASIRKVIRMKTRMYTHAIICEAIEKVTGVTYSELSHKTRKHSVIFARHIYCYQMRDKTKLSLKEIGQTLGGRDHTTIINSIKVYHTLNEVDDNFYQLADRIENQVDILSADLQYETSKSNEN